MYCVKRLQFERRSPADTLKLSLRGRHDDNSGEALAPPAKLFSLPVVLACNCLGVFERGFIKMRR
jgi:hypothetical protein